jgi:hypothetical protein
VNGFDRTNSHDFPEKRALPIQLLAEFGKPPMEERVLKPVTIYDIVIDRN